MKNKQIINEINKEVFIINNIDFNQLLEDELDGLNLTFDRIKVPTGGGLAFEVPSNDSQSNEMVKEIKGVILYHHPIHAYYNEKYTGGNNPPDCGSMDGHKGLDISTGEVKECKECVYNTFGSAEDGAGKACKQRRRIYLLREGENLPIILSLPTGSISEFSKFIVRLISSGKKSNSIVTKFTLKKVQNSNGIAYSQVICSVDRHLSEKEKVCIQNMSEQIKKLAGKINIEDVPVEIEE